MLLYGSERADQFGPLKLKKVRDLIIERGSLRSAQFNDAGDLVKSGTSLCREYVNNVIKALLRTFRWAASEEKIPAAVCESLMTVRPQPSTCLAISQKVLFSVISIAQGHGTEERELVVACQSTKYVAICLVAHRSQQH